MSHETQVIAKLKRTCLSYAHQLQQLEQLAIAQNEVLIMQGSVACAAMWDAVFSNPGVDLRFEAPSDAEVYEIFKKQPPPKPGQPSMLVKP